MGFRTLASIKAEFLNHFPSCPSATADSYILDAIQQVAVELPLYNDSASIKLTADTFSYPLTTSAASPYYERGTSTPKLTHGLWRLDDAYYLQDSSNKTRLVQSSESQIKEGMDVWRLADSATPTHVYLAGSSSGALSVCLYPAPETTSSPADGTGYPRVDLWYSFYPDTAPASIPTTLRNDQVVLYWSMYRYAVRVADARWEVFKSEYESAKASAMRALNANEVDNPPRFNFKTRWPIR